MRIIRIIGLIVIAILLAGISTGCSGGQKQEPERLPASFFMPQERHYNGGDAPFYTVLMHGQDGASFNKAKEMVETRVRRLSDELVRRGWNVREEVKDVVDVKHRIFIVHRILHYRKDV